ncbi:hypothetical protein HPB52_018293 [Rhipicephalus sanguineus]|uniref:CCHC-type domain-containing protein n=1 Tax=Rhipicephalus sanguineus TaxID=34632 RepID=A0A9D4T460_RHISA|nr:hypothetical protein HPB52_018293 [Rhipicephalus sanguineus]
MSTAMRVEVDGVEISPDQITRAQGWKTAGEKVKQGGVGSLGLTPISQASQDGAKAATDVNGRGNDLGGATGNDLRQQRTKKRINKGKLLKGARMPHLPRGDIKIVMRPRDGLRISDVTSVEISRAIMAAAQVDVIAAREDVICLNHQQNIVVVSTSKREHADRYAMVERIDIRGTSHEVSAYESAPHGTVKGVIRGIPLEDTAQEIQDLVVHRHNPTALQANRMGRTRSVVIAFEGHKVPNYVRYGNLLIECTLHRKQIDACYACGRVGHRMDVCPNPQDKICRGCGIANPGEDHKCEPKCGLCGGEHLTADRACKARFKTPYVVRRRRWERRRAEEDNEDRNQGKRGSKERPQRSASSQRGRSQTPARSSNGGGHQSRSRSKSRSGDGGGGGNRRGKRTSRGSSGRSRSRTKSLSQSSVARVSETELPSLTPSQLPSPRASPEPDSNEVAELKKIIERQNAQIQEQNAQIRALMSKIDALASGSSANGGPQGGNNTEENAGGKRKTPRREPPSPPLGRAAGAARPTQQAPNNQEAMDAEESTVNRETATAMAQILKEGELPAILAAITQINKTLSAIDARFESLEGEVRTLSVKHERLATKVVTTTKHPKKMKQRSNKKKKTNGEDVTVIYQWNCRGIRNKEAELLLHIDALEHKPDVIALQETNGKPRLPGYVTYTDPTEEGTAVLVRSNVAATQHVTPQGGCEHTLRQYDFDRVVSQAKRLAGSRPLLILGDFNAPHTTWGYKYQSKRGKALAKTMEDHEMALLNEPDVVTRRGNSANRDTTPDLSWLSGGLDAAWRNEDVDLGSDHSVIGIIIKGPQYRAVLGTARVTDWDKMRKDTQEAEEASENDVEADRKQTYAEWARDQKKALEKFTQEITTTAQTPFVDARLAHMWAARHSLTRRWKRQRHNKKLVKRIAVLNKQITEYAAKLCRETWLSTCDGLQGKLSARKTWCLLRHLIDPLSSKTATNRNLTKVINTYKGDGRRLLEELKTKYLKTERGQFPTPERYEEGTPQGSVLSPLLFNLALLPLPNLLQQIEGVDHAFYADDITVWTNRAGSNAW